MRDWVRQSISKSWERIKKDSPINLPASKKSKRKRKRARREQLRREQKQTAERCLSYLKGFWNQFNAADTDSRRLELLKIAANPGWPKVSVDLRKRLRSQFRQNAFRMLAIPVEKCGTCDRRPQEKHHIIPLRFGGINANLNLILICMDCHDEIHPWMK